MLSQLHAAALAALLTVSVVTTAESATLGILPTNNPLLTAENVTVEFMSDFYFAAGTISSAAANGAALAPAPSDFVIQGFAFDDLLLDVFVDGGVDAFLTGEILSVGFGDNVIELLFATLEDASGLFGSRILVLLTAGSTDFPINPLTTDFSVDDASAAITAPVPLPAALPLLLAALAALRLARGRARA